MAKQQTHEYEISHSINGKKCFGNCYTVLHFDIHVNIEEAVNTMHF